MARDRLVNLALLMGSLISTVLLIEVGLRVFGYERPDAYAVVLGREKIRQPLPGIRYLYPGHADYRQVWPSNPRGYFDLGTNGIPYRVNNYGFRGGDLTLVRNEKIRIAFLGDSFCWGTGVRQAHLFATLIERRLNQSRPLGQTYEVYNFCLPGSSTAEEAALYQLVARYFRPDLLVVWYFLNDVNQPPRLYVQPRARRDARRSSSRFLCLMLDPFNQLRDTRELKEQIDRAYQDGHSGLSAVEEALVRLRQITDEDGVIRFLAVIPWLHRLESDRYPFRKAHRAITARAGREGFAVLDLLTVFDGQRARELWVHPVDHHANEIGHAMMARAMAEFLEPQLEEMGESLLTAAAIRRRIPLPSSLAEAPAREWYRPFIALSRSDDCRSDDCRSDD